MSTGFLIAIAIMSFPLAVFLEGVLVMIADWVNDPDNWEDDE